uniref:Ribosome biogenesis protein BRX1 homolog n=1 Tax=Angiostrongylus cantonensis TaxID=6313 RepID=A0A0K0DRM7_ANGCA
MGKYQNVRKFAGEEKSEVDSGGDETSISDDDTHSEHGILSTEKKHEKKKRAILWTNRERVLVICSRGADVRTRHLMNDVKVLLPHAKGDSKLDKQKSLVVINEIAEMKNCTKVLYFESRKHKVYGFTSPNQFCMLVFILALYYVNLCFCLCFYIFFYGACSVVLRDVLQYIRGPWFDPTPWAHQTFHSCTGSELVLNLFRRIADS